MKLFPFATGDCTNDEKFVPPAVVFVSVPSAVVTIAQAPIILLPHVYSAPGVRTNTDLLLPILYPCAFVAFNLIDQLPIPNVCAGFCEVLNHISVPFPGL
jgi:hypothetical protein